MIIRVFLVLTFLISQLITLHAQQKSEFLLAKPTSKKNEFNESYSQPKVFSGGVLLGYRIGSFIRKRPVRPLFLGVDTSSTKIFCLALTSQDARYHALNEYEVSKNGLITKPILVDILSIKFKQELNKYKNSELAVNAYLLANDDCSSSAKIYFPQLETGRHKKEELQILINSEGRSGSLSLLKIINSNKTLQNSSETYCVESTEDSSIAFDLICSLPIKAMFENKNIEVELKLNDGFELERHIFTLYVPSFESLH